MRYLLKKAYTLIEVLLIIAVLAAIFAVAIPAFRSQSEDLKINKTTEEIQFILQAAAAYYLDSIQNNLPE